MRLSIGHLGIRIRAQASNSEDARRAGSEIEQRVPVELSAYLGPNLLAQREVIRIQSLKVRLRIRRGEVSSEDVVQAWVSAFLQELFRTLELPSQPDAFGVYRAPDEARHRARFLRELLCGGESGRWFYEEFAPCLGVARSSAVLSVLLQHPETLSALSAEGILEAALSVLGDLQLEELIRALSREPIPPSDGKMVEILDAAASVNRPGSWRLGGRRFALLVWVNTPQLAGRISPRAVFNALQAVDWICLHGFRGSEDTVPPIVRPWLDIVAKDSDSGGRLAELDRRIEDLARPGERPATLDANVPEPWLTSNYAGVLLALPFLGRIDMPMPPQPGMSHLLAAIGLALCDRPQDMRLLNDPAIYTFAGMGKPITGGAIGPDLAGAIADAVALEMGRSIRSFRSLSAQSVRRMFLQKPGRILVEKEAIQLVLEPSPYNIVLHTAGLDGRTVLEPWLFRRELCIHLEGL